MEWFAVVVAYLLLSGAIAFGIIAFLLTFFFRSHGIVDPARCHKQPDDPGADDDSSPDIGTNLVLMTWSEVACSYRNSGQEVRTLHGAYGKLKTGEVTAVMGPRYVLRNE